MFCTNCGSSIQEGAVFCTNCGQTVKTDENANAVPVTATDIPPAPAPVMATPDIHPDSEPEKSVFCTNCGSNIPKGAAFCTSCGKAVNGQTPQKQTAEPQNQYVAPPQSSSPPAKKTKKKVLVVIGILAAVVVVVISAIVIINNIRASNMPPWEAYVSFEDFARAAEINDILSVGALNEKGFYALMGGAFVGHFLEPIISPLIASLGFGSGISVTADFDFVNGPKLGSKYNVPPELRQNYNYLVRRTGIEGSKTYLALRFDGERVFGVFIPYSGWIVMVYEEGALVKF